MLYISCQERWREQPSFHHLFPSSGVVCVEWAEHLHLSADFYRWHTSSDDCWKRNVAYPVRCWQTDDPDKEKWLLFCVPMPHLKLLPRVCGQTSLFCFECRHPLIHRYVRREYFVHTRNNAFYQSTPDWHWNRILCLHWIFLLLSKHDGNLL